MATFPQLRTDAVMQYPAERELRFTNQVLRFVDGSEQRYRGFGATLRRWVVRLDLLDEAEEAALSEFFTANQGGFGSFAFTDPWDGTEYADCSLEGDEFAAQWNGEMRAQAALIIRENRG